MILLCLIAEAAIKALARVGLFKRFDPQEGECFPDFPRMFGRNDRGSRYVVVALPSYQLKESFWHCPGRMAWHRLDLTWFEGRGFEAYWREIPDFDPAKT